MANSAVFSGFSGDANRGQMRDCWVEVEVEDEGDDSADSEVSNLLVMLMLVDLTLILPLTLLCNAN